jgi:hypothetical protein
MFYLTDTMQHDIHDARHDDDTTTERRVSIREAAEMLDVTTDAIRARLRRGTLRKEIGPKGETIVVLDTDTIPPVGDTTQHDTDTTHPTADYVAAVEKQVEILRAELAARNQELSEMRRLLAGALERIPAIEAPPDTPSEPRESPQRVSEESVKGEVSPEQEKRSWWQRLFS